MRQLRGNIWRKCPKKLTAYFQECLGYIIHLLLALIGCLFCKYFTPESAVPLRKVTQKTCANRAQQGKLVCTLAERWAVAVCWFCRVHLMEGPQLVFQITHHLKFLPLILTVGSDQPVRLVNFFEFVLTHHTKLLFFTRFDTSSSQIAVRKPIQVVCTHERLSQCTRPLATLFL